MGQFSNPVATHPCTNKVEVPPPHPRARTVMVNVKDTTQTVLKSTWKEENDYLNIDFEIFQCMKIPGRFKKWDFSPKRLPASNISWIPLLTLQSSKPKSAKGTLICMKSNSWKKRAWWAHFSLFTQTNHLHYYISVKNRVLKYWITTILKTTPSMSLKLKKWKKPTWSIRRFYL